MCGRFVADWDTGDLVERYGAEIAGDLPGHSWNVSPFSKITIVLDGRDGTRRLAPSLWSLIPPWSPTTKLAYPTFNARVESALEKRTFRESAQHMRCIIPATGYYEWKSGKPHYFKLPGDIFNIAGLYTWWRPDEQSAFSLTCTILTRDAVGDLATIHDRMPVMVPDDMVDDWLSPAVAGSEILPAASSATEEIASHIQFHEVRPLKGDGPDLIEAADVARLAL